MTAPTHVVFGIAASLTVMHISGAQPSAVCWLAILFGSLAPDLDSPRSTIARPGSIFERLLPRLLVDLLNAFGQAASWIAQKILGHRGALHWPLLGAALIGTGLLSRQPWCSWFGLAYLSHIVADFCTVGGVPLLAPFSERRISWSPIRTGSLLEALVCLLLCCFVFFTGYQALPEEIRQSFQLYTTYLAERR